MFFVLGYFRLFLENSLSKCEILKIENSSYNFCVILFILLMVFEI